jgi:hypothetical protein
VHRPIIRHQDFSRALQRGDVLDPASSQNPNRRVEPSAPKGLPCINSHWTHQPHSAGVCSWAAE